MEAHGPAAAGSPLTHRDIQVDPTARPYWVAPGAPLLVVVHGLGLPPAVMAAWTELAARGPATGLAIVFPEGLCEAWDDSGLGRADGADDDAFIVAVVDEPVRSGAVKADRVFLVDLSNGASFAERLARTVIVSPRGRARPRTAARAAVCAAYDRRNGGPQRAARRRSSLRPPVMGGGSSDALHPVAASCPRGGRCRGCVP